MLRPRQSIGRLCTFLGEDMKQTLLKTSLALCALGMALNAGAALAQDTPPPSDKLLVCKGLSATLSIPSCGGVKPGCKMSITSGGKTTQYAVVRKKGTDGALTYQPQAGARPRCTVVISPLQSGYRRLQNVSCSKGLKGTSCQIIEVTPTPTPES